MLYTIPTNKIEKLEKIIKRANKKGANILFIKGEQVLCDGTLYVHHPHSPVITPTPIKIRCIECFVEGSYKINDWIFLGTIEFKDAGNIIRLAMDSFDKEIPAKYLHTPKICEHCGKVRNRRDTYLIYNEKTNEFKQVGSSCLLEYTRGLDADVCASIMSSLDKVLDLAKLEYEDSEFYSSAYNYSSDCGLDSYSVKAHAIALVKRYGYHRMENGVGSATDLSNFMFKLSLGDSWNRLYGDLELASDEEIKAIDEYAKNVDIEEYGYMRNASIAWLSKSVEYRDFGLICSFVNTYLKELAKREKELARANASNNVYVGNVGDRITITVKSVRVLYTKAPYSYYGDTSYVYEIIDTDGHTFKWSTTSMIEADDVITATIKEHSEYRGVKQTVITRGKVVK